MNSTWRSSAATGMLCLILTAPAAALINPNYTPVDLVRQSELILRLQLTAPGADGKLGVTIVETVQGKAPAKLVLVMDRDLQAAAKEGQADLPYDKNRKVPALLFAGDFSAASNEDASVRVNKPVGVLHADIAAPAEGTRWFGVFRRADGSLLVARDTLDLKAVWAGGNRMLARAVEYVRADPRADIPTAVGARWGGELNVASLKGKVNGAAAVDPTGGGRPHLFVLADAGDRLYRPTGDGTSFQDVAAKLKLSTRSKLAAWGDFNGDGRLDLASWDGKSLDLALCGDGTFQLKKGAGGFGHVPIGLAALSTAGETKTSLLVSTPAEPILMTLGKSGLFLHEPLPKAEKGHGWLGQAGPCTVADFDADGTADVLQPFEKGALLYAGKAAGAFEPPQTACGARLGESITAVLAGDFDADGLADALITSSLGCLVLRNLGGGKFAETLGEAGEVEYNAKPRSAGAMLCDINNDGRQEFVLLYPNMPPQFYFNRGFACFGYAVELELRDSDLKVRDATSSGQQAGAAADFNGDGASDVAMVSNEGQVWVLFREAAEGPKLGLTVALAPGAPGPVNVLAADGKRGLGVRVVSPGGVGALFGKCTKGPLDLTWRFPGRGEQTKRVIVLKPTRLVLPAAGK